MACHLGLVLQSKHATGSKRPTSTNDDYLTVKTSVRNAVSSDDGDDGDELTSSPYLFPNSSSPQWNVDILRGSYFELQKDGPSGVQVQVTTPMPIIEFTKGAENTGHVLIRLQGLSSNNDAFSLNRSPEPVTLVFDACFRN